ncbi:MAG: response regulator [Deltaproteobacteria bacterium]|nr:response regulator [Deltaproteobacteria bacterium]
MLAKQTLPTHSWHIVLIDDERDIRDVVSISLKDSGYHVEVAADGQAGLDLCLEKKPQIVITDIRMPGVDGIQVLTALKKSDPDIEVIVITAFADMDLAVKALQLDASDFITKPIHDETLHLALRRARERYTARKQARDYTALLEKENATQAQILHQDKMMSLGRLAASVVHEINNPLSGILNYSRLMIKVLEKEDLNEERRSRFLRYLDLVEKESDRCSKIVSGLLAFSRKSPPSFAPVNVADLLERCIALSRHRLALSGIDLTRSIPGGLPAVRGDFNQLQQCVINLIFNAMDAMPHGGKIHIESRVEAQGGMVVISFTDTGSGISPKDLPHIFEPFYTTKKEGYGVGLGLSTVYGIMAQHHGSVAVESKPGDGTVFFLKLPPAAS